MFLKPLLRNNTPKLPVIAFSIFAGFLFNACHTFSSSGPDEDKKVVARVMTDYLYESDVKAHFKNKMPAGKDSLASRKQVIDNWIQEKLIFHKALNNLPEAKKDKEAALQDYYESLIRYEYEQALIDENVDTQIAKKALREFYEENPERFRLNQPVVKFRYVIVPRDAPHQDRLPAWFKQEENFYLDSLYQYARQFARHFSLADKKWYYYGNIRHRLNLPEENQPWFLRQFKQNEVIKTRDSVFNYYVYLTDFKKQDQRAPLSLKREDIKKMMLNRQKIELIQQMEKEVLQEGLEKNNVQRYD